MNIVLNIIDAINSHDLNNEYVVFDTLCQPHGIAFRYVSLVLLSLSHSKKVMYNKRRLNIPHIKYGYKYIFSGRCFLARNKPLPPIAWQAPHLHVGTESLKWVI